MKWDKHIQYIIYIIYVFAKIKIWTHKQGHKISNSNVLRFLHSYISYGIIASGGVYEDNMTRLQNIQTRILKIIHKNYFVENTPLNIRQVFTLEALMYHYEDLKEIYKISNSKIRNKSIQLSKTEKAVSNKNSYMVAL